MKCIIAAAFCSLSGGALAQDHVIIKPAADHVVVEYRLDEPTSRFAFDTKTPPEARIVSLDAGVALDAGGASMSEPRESLGLAVWPDRIRTDAAYPVLTRAGDGWMIYLPSLLSDAPSTVPAETITVADGWSMLVGSSGAPFNGFVYVGPAGSWRDGDTVIADPSIAGWMADDARSAALNSDAWYAGRLRLASPRPPVLLINRLPEEDRSSYVGDVTPNGFINLQFAAGSLPPERDQRFTDLVQPFVAHEVFHNWQGGKQTAVQGVNSRWLDEGAAEYFSLVAQAASSGAMARSRSIMAERLSSCLKKMEGEETGLLALTPAQAEATRYDCGAVVHWLVDIEMAEKDGAWGVWRGLLSSNDGYSVSDFLSAAPPRAGSGLATLLHGGEDLRGGIMKSLEGHAVLAAPAPSAWANAAMWPLLQSNCRGGMGVTTTAAGRWILDTGDRCGPLSGDPELLGADGHMFADAGAEAYRSVAVACESATDVELTLNSAGEVRRVRAPCSHEIRAPDQAYQVIQLP